MTTTTTEASESAIWNFLQGTSHFGCGGWSWDSGEPGDLKCNCGEVLTMTRCAQPWLGDDDTDHYCELPLPQGHPGECVCECGMRWCETLTMVRELEQSPHRSDVLNYEHFDCCGQGMVPKDEASQAFCPPCEPVLIELPWFEVPLGDCVLYAGRWVLLEAMWPATDDAQWLGITIRYGGESRHCQVQAGRITVVRRYITEG